MHAGHAHSPSHERPAWGEPRRGRLGRWLEQIRASLGVAERSPVAGLRELPVALRRGPLAPAYLDAAHDRDHARAASVAVEAMERAITAGEWWPADVWAHRALWHFEQAGEALEATRQARRIGDLRAAAGDPASARRYYAEAIDEARDLGAEQEQGLAAVGLGRAFLELGDVTSARRLASAAVDLLGRAAAPAAQIEEARKLLGEERPVGEGAEDDR
jgi:tetratricopeptide (TPR) repeat protein